ncbi:type II toxin-antitoxin system VapC family toxin [soil metagenome]
MRLLLDTHALLWWLAGDERLPVIVREAIADDANEVLVSAVSAYEIVFKHRLGRLDDVDVLISAFEPALLERGLLPLAVSVAHAVRAGYLAPSHRDPFDRLLIAQAQVEGLALVSNERLFDSFGVSRLW